MKNKTYTEDYNLSFNELLTAMMLKTYLDKLPDQEHLKMVRSFCLHQGDDYIIDGNNLLAQIECGKKMIADCVKKGWLENDKIDRKTKVHIILPVYRYLMNMDYCDVVSNLSENFAKYLCEYGKAMEEQML